MATNLKPNSNGLVNGTENADEITWEAAWAKAITVNANGGDDTINFTNSTYNNKLYGYAGNDTIRGGKGNDYIDGGLDDDLLYGTAGNNTIKGQSGNDTIHGGTGIDKIYGGNGNDQLLGGQGNDIIYGGSGNDLIKGHDGNDDLVGDEGNDTIEGGNGDDRLWGTSGSNVLKGQDGNDIIYGGTQKDTIYGGAGDDQLLGGSGDDIIYGEADNDIIKGNAGNDVIYGEAGNDTIYGNAGNDKLYGGDGSDFLRGEQGNNTISGGNGDDYLAGGIGNDELWGNADNDYIYGQDGKDTIYGGTGNDHIWGEAGDDIIYAGSGNDEIISGPGNDTIYGEKGNNLLKGGDGNDYIEGGLNDDKIYGGNGVDKLFGQKGKDRIYGDAGADYIAGGENYDVIDGGDDDDVIYGYDSKNNNTDDGGNYLKAGAGNDTVVGAAGDDVIYGDEGNDSLYGYAGNDTIYGGTGDDTINGGKGKNTYVFSTGDGADTIVNGGGVDTLVFTSEANINNITAQYVGNDVRINYTGGTVTLKNYSASHSAKYIQVGKTTKNIADILPVPEAPASSNILINGVHVYSGTNDADTINATTTGTNRVFATQGNDSITTGGDQWTNSYIYGGKGNDTITSGAGTDIIYGGGGKNTIYLSRGSGSDYTYDENDNTFVFKDISNLNQLTFTMGEQGYVSYIADLTIKGYGNDTDSLTIGSFFNTEGYDYSKLKVQAGVNGEAVSLYELINNSNLKNSYFTGTWKPRPKSPTTSPAQLASQIDNVIYGNTPGIGSHNVLWGIAGGNNTFYSGGTNEGLMGQTNGGFTMIYGGDGDEIFHAEGNKIYYNGQTYENREYLIVVNKPDGTKEVKNGVFYNHAIAEEQPYTKWVDSFGDKHEVYYTEDSNIINQARENDYIISRGFLSDGTGDIAFVEYIKSGVLEVSGGDGNDTFYTGFGATGGDGNDTIIGSGVMYGGRGDDKFILTDEYNDPLIPMYNVYTNSGNDYIDTTGISAGDDTITTVRFDEGVNTLIVDGSRAVNIIIGESKTYQQETSDSFIETRYMYQARNTHYTAYEQNGDLYIATNNSTKSQSEESVSYDGKGAGVLIIKGWSNLTDEQKDKFTISYRELLASVNYVESTFTIREFLKIIDGTSESFIPDSNGRHTWINEYGDEKINETYTFNVINNSNGELATINEAGATQTAVRNTYDDWGDLTGTEERSVDYFITGGKGAQLINGGDGNDVIFGDNINGHDENGKYIYATANDGADTINGGKGNDYIIGGAGNDFIDGGSGTDYIDGGEGNDLLVGGTLGTEEEFNKSLLTSTFNLKEIYGGNGNDTIYSLGAYTDGNFDANKAKSYQGGGTYFTNNIYAGDGNDEIHANGYRDMVYAGKGNDTIYSYVNDNDSFYNSNSLPEIFGEDGDDLIILKGHADVRAFGGDGNDIINARESSVNYYNMLYGDNGNDTIYGSDGWDIIYTGQGNNYVEAGDGNDEIRGSDLWLGRGEDNYIDAGAGNDYIRTSGSSTVLGGAGDDTIYFAMGYKNVPSNLYIDGGDGDDTYITDGGYGIDTIVASAGKDVIQFKGFVKDNTSYKYNGNDLVLSYTSDGYPAGLILKDYKLGGFNNFTIKTYGGYDEGYAQNGQYKMADFINYLDGNYSMATVGTNGDDNISTTDNIDGYGGNDFILAHSTTSTEENPQIINTGSGNNSVLAQSAYTVITGGIGNDEYNLHGCMTTLVDEGGNNTVTVADPLNNDNLYFDITLNGNGNNTITSADSADYCAYTITAIGAGNQTIDINSAGTRSIDKFDDQYNYLRTDHYSTVINTGSGDDNISIYEGTVNSGAGNDTITVKQYGSATLNGGEGDDSYVVNHYATLYDSKILIDDTAGQNNLTINNVSNDSVVAHDDYNIIFNVDQSGNLKNFSYHYAGHNDYTGLDYNIDIENTGCLYVGTSDINVNYYSVANGFYNHSYSSSGQEPGFNEGGIRLTKDTMETLGTISTDDGYTITSDDITAAKAAVAGWLTANDYADVQAACSDLDSTKAQNNLVAITNLINDNLNWTQIA